MVNTPVKEMISMLLMFGLFKMETMGDYHDFYLKTDVLLSTDVFERLLNLISACLEYY